MQDLSHLAAKSLAVSSMSGGNTTSSNEAAMTAPGSLPVDTLPQHDQHSQSDPALEITDKPIAVLTRGTGYTPAPAAWKETTDG